MGTRNLGSRPTFLPSIKMQHAFSVPGPGKHTRLTPRPAEEARHPTANKPFRWFIYHHFDGNTNGENRPLNSPQMPLNPWRGADQFPGASEIKDTPSLDSLRPSGCSPRKAPPHLSLTHNSAEKIRILQLSKYLLPSYYL